LRRDHFDRSEFYSPRYLNHLSQYIKWQQKIQEERVW